MNRKMPNWMRNQGNNKEEQHCTNFANEKYMLLIKALSMFLFGGKQEALTYLTECFYLHKKLGKKHHHHYLTNKGNSILRVAVATFQPSFL